MIPSNVQWRLNTLISWSLLRGTSLVRIRQTFLDLLPLPTGLPTALRYADLKIWMQLSRRALMEEGWLSLGEVCRALRQLPLLPFTFPH
jgi:hypothetical protein